MLSWHVILYEVLRSPLCCKLPPIPLHSSHTGLLTNGDAFWLQAAEAAVAAATNGKQEAGAEGSATDSPEQKVANGGLEAKSGAKAEPGQAAAAGEDSDSDVVCMDDEEEGDSAHSGYSGFYRASRETGRANVLLALQVIDSWHCL